MPLHIGCVIFPAWELLDLLGPFSVLLHAASLSDDQVQFYFVASNISEPIESFSRLATIATVSVSNAPQFDIILVPGGAGAVRASNDNTLLAFLRTQAAGAKFVASICTGSGILANAGLLKNRRATSNKAAFGIMSQYGSNVKYVRSARFIEDGNIWSASGVTAGVDMAFEITRRAFSDEIATSVAKSWGYEPLEGTYDPFCDHHPEPNPWQSAFMYWFIYFLGWKVGPIMVDQFHDRKGKRRVATVLIDGFAVTDVAFVDESLVLVSNIHWYDIVHAHTDEDDRIVKGGLGSRFSEVLAARADHGFSSTQPLFDESTDVVFVPSVSSTESLNQRPDALRVVEQLASAPSSVNVIVCGNVSDLLAKKLGLVIEFDETGWHHHQQFYFSKDTLGALRASVHVMAKVVGADRVKKGLIDMELSIKLLPAEVQF